MLLLCCALPAIGRRSSPSQPSFLRSPAYSLDKQKVSLPGDLEGQTICCSFPLKRSSRRTSIPGCRRRRLCSTPTFSFAITSCRWRSGKTLSSAGGKPPRMRSDQTDPETWHWIVPLWVDRKNFFDDPQIPNEKQVVILLIDRQGHILWRAFGRDDRGQAREPDDRGRARTNAFGKRPRLAQFCACGLTRPFLGAAGQRAFCALRSAFSSPQAAWPARLSFSAAAFRRPARGRGAAVSSAQRRAAWSSAPPRPSTRAPDRGREDAFDFHQLAKRSGPAANEITAP